MSIRLLIAHARGEERCAEQLAAPLREAGFEVAHEGTVFVGESVVEDASRVLHEGGPVVLCGTIKAVGTKWARMVVSAARGHGCKVFCVQMDEDADVETLAFGEKVAEYWHDPERAVRELRSALQAAFPAGDEGAQQIGEDAAEARYRRLALESCDIVDLANLPESERHIATRKLELRRLYVPLSVIVEARDKSEGPTDSLEMLEKRRVEGRGWWRAAKDSHGQVNPSPRVPLGERLAASRRLVVLGDPGAGKTTLLRWLSTAYLLRLKRDPDRSQLPAVETLPDEEWLPVIIRCRDLPPECVTGALDDVLGHTLRKSELGEIEAEALRRLVRTRLDQGRALLLVDGLDEIGEAALRSRFAQQLEQIHLAFPAAPIVVTSRIVGYRDMGYRIGRGFEHVSVAEFSPTEKDDFAKRWCALTELPERREAAIKELISDIHSSDRIERLTGNPMLLTTMALVKRKIGRLPSRRADLYWEALQVLLNWRPEVDLPIDHREAVPQLEYVAYDMCNRAVQQIREDEILGLLDRMREEYPRLHEVRHRSSRDFLRALEARTGIIARAGEIRHMGRPTPVYEFRHLTFQEYLAALALVDGVYPDRSPSEVLARAISRISGCVDEVDTQEGIQETVTVENWREAVRLAVANAKYDEADDVLRAVLVPEAVEVGTKRPRAILAALCLADEPRVSDEVAHDVMQSLVQAIDDQDRYFRMDTALHLAVAGVMGSRWRVHLQAVLIGEVLQRNPEKRAPVGHVLGMALATDPQGTETLREPDIAVTDDGTALALLFGAAAWVRYSNTLDLQDVLPLSFECLGKSAALTHAALTFLDNSLYHSGDEISDNSELTIGVALRRFWDDLGVREAGLSIIGSLQLADFRSSTEAELDSDDLHVRRAAARAVGRISSVEAVPILINHVSDPDEEVRELLIGALGAIGDNRAVPSLISCLEDEKPTVRIVAAESLGMLTDPRAVRALIDCLRDADRMVRRAAAQSLGSLKDPSALDPLLSSLADNTSETASAVMRALGAIGDVRAVDPLILYLQDEVPHVRQAAAFALANIKDERAVEPLLDQLSDELTGIQSTAAYALGQIGDARAVGPLSGRIRRSKEPRVISAMANALGQIGGPQALESLLALSSHADEAIRAETARALGHFADPEAIRSLRHSLSDVGHSVRQSALGALARNLDDALDRKLLSRDLDGLLPFLDPQKPVKLEWVQHVQRHLNLSVPEVKIRYQALAEEFNLILAYEETEPVATVS
jgi:HEAT repeat protein/GTPase SAR1 family protein